MPALLTITCRPPNRVAAASTAAFIAASSATSTRQKQTACPFAPRSPARAMPSASITSNIATCAPSSAMRSTQARPIPTAPPVTMAVCPESRFMAISFGMWPGTCPSGRHAPLGRDLGNFGALGLRRAAQQVDRAVGRILERFQHHVRAGPEQDLRLGSAVRRRGDPPRASRRAGESYQGPARGVVAEPGGMDLQGRDEPLGTAQRQFGNELRVRRIAELRLEPQFAPAVDGQRVEVNPKHRNATVLQPDAHGGPKAPKSKDDDRECPAVMRPGLGRLARGALALEDREERFEECGKLV